MRRDMDLIRLIMLQVEQDHTGPNELIEYEDFERDLVIEGFTPDQVEYHLRILVSARMFEMPGNAGMYYIISGLTPAGHDFVDSVRDETIWKLTKGGANAAGGFTIDTLSAIGKAFLRKQVEKYTGLDIS